MEKSHGDFNAISNEKEKHEKLKEDIRTIKSSNKLTKKEDKKVKKTES